MRKSINTLAMMVQDVLHMEPMSGHLFLFRSRSGNKIKALYYEQFDEADAIPVEELLQEENTITVTYTRNKPSAVPCLLSCHAK